MRAPCSTPPRHMGKGSDSTAYWRASMGKMHYSGAPARADARSGLRIASLGDPLEENRREIPLTCIRQHGEDHRALRGISGHPGCGSECGPGGDSAENALLAGELPCVLDRLGFRDRNDPMGYLAIEHGRQEIRRPALDLVRGPRLARK